MAEDIFAKWENSIDLDGLMKDVEEASKGSKEFREVPVGKYEVKVTKMELKSSKKNDPMLSIYFEVLEGEYKGEKIFFNQVLTNGYGIHSANEMLRSLCDGEKDIQFLGFRDYANLILDVHEFIDGKFEYVLDYGKNDKGFNTYDITDIFDV